MAQKIKINLTITQEVKKDIKKRDNFNSSAYFENKYREEFMNEEGIRHSLEALDKKREKLSNKLINIASTKTIIPKVDSNRCPTCTMFFNEDISIRKKTHIYKDLYVCKECADLRKPAIERIVLQMKEAERGSDEEDEII